MRGQQRRRRHRDPTYHPPDPDVPSLSLENDSLQLRSSPSSTASKKQLRPLSPLLPHPHPHPHPRPHPHEAMVIHGSDSESQSSESGMSPVVVQTTASTSFARLRTSRPREVKENRSQQRGGVGVAGSRTEEGCVGGVLAPCRVASPSYLRDSNLIDLSGESYASSVAVAASAASGGHQRGHVGHGRSRRESKREVVQLNESVRFAGDLTPVAPICFIVVVSRFHPFSQRMRRLRGELESDQIDIGRWIDQADQIERNAAFGRSLLASSGEMEFSSPRVVPVRKKLTIGRGANSDIQITLRFVSFSVLFDLQHRFVSRKHCEFRLHGSNLTIAPTGDTNKTRLNGNALQCGQETTLKDEDCVRIAGYEFHCCFSPRSLSATLARYGGHRLMKQSVPVSVSDPVSDVVTLPPRRTGLYFDQRMDRHRQRRSHYECPARTSEMMKALKEAGLSTLCQFFQSRFASKEELALAHDPKYIEQVFDQTVRPTDDCFVVKQTCIAAQLACGGVIELVERLCRSEIDNGLAVVRPPGHHAGISTAEGFCFFNNVAVGARVATTRYSKRVAIVDWDVHHGNGTEEIFRKDPNVFYYSSHRYGDFYPGTGEAREIGEGAGSGTNMNVPLTESFGDADIVLSTLHLLLPALLQFQPDIILVSAGFDAGAGDPLGTCSVSPESFGLLTSMLFSVTRQLILALEGGYNPQASAACAVECLKVLLGQASPRIPLPIDPPRGSTVGTIRRVRQEHEASSVMLRTKVSSTRRSRGRKRKRDSSSKVTGPNKKRRKIEKKSKRYRRQSILPF